MAPAASCARPSPIRYPSLPLQTRSHPIPTRSRPTRCARFRGADALGLSQIQPGRPALRLFRHSICAPDIHGGIGCRFARSSGGSEKCPPSGFLPSLRYRNLLRQYRPLRRRYRFNTDLIPPTPPLIARSFGPPTSENSLSRAGGRCRSAPGGGRPAGRSPGWGEWGPWGGWGIWGIWGRGLTPAPSLKGRGTDKTPPALGEGSRRRRGGEASPPQHHPLRFPRPV